MIYFVYLRAGFSDGLKKKIVPCAIFVFIHPSASELIVYNVGAVYLFQQ